GQRLGHGFLDFHSPTFLDERFCRLQYHVMQRRDLLRVWRSARDDANCLRETRPRHASRSIAATVFALATIEASFSEPLLATISAEASRAIARARSRETRLAMAPIGERHRSPAGRFQIADSSDGRARKRIT